MDPRLLEAVELEAPRSNDVEHSKGSSAELPAPLSSFQQHALPESAEMPHTRLMDSRWVDAFSHRLHEIDSYVEMRKKRRRLQLLPLPLLEKQAARAKQKEVGRRNRCRRSCSRSGCNSCRGPGTLAPVGQGPNNNGPSPRRQLRSEKRLRCHSSTRHA